GGSPTTPTTGASDRVRAAACRSCPCPRPTCPRGRGACRAPPGAATSSLVEALEQRAPLVRTETLQPARLADLEFAHDVAGAHFADARQRFEDGHDLQLREHLARLVAPVGLIEQLAQRERADLQFVLHLRPLPSRGRGFLEGLLALLGRERGRV